MTASQRARSAPLTGARPERVRRAGRATVLGAAFALALAACGSDSEPASSVATTTATTVASSVTTSVAPATTVASSATTTTAATDDSTPSTEPSSEQCPEFVDKPDLPLELCDKGEKVSEVQQGLVDAGYDIVVDGFFGGQTRNAVLEFQAANGLEVDGVVGPLTFGELFPS